MWGYWNICILFSNCAKKNPKRGSWRFPKKNLSISISFKTSKTIGFRCSKRYRDIRIPLGKALSASLLRVNIQNDQNKRHVLFVKAYRNHINLYVALFWHHIQRWSCFRLKKVQNSPTLLYGANLPSGGSHIGWRKVWNCAMGGTKMVPLGKGELK